MHLLLFFTYNNSLKLWVDTGLVERECALYLRMIRKWGWRVSFITFGDEQDLEYQDCVGPIAIIPFYSRFSRPRNRYLRFFQSLILPLLIGQTIKDADVIKSNQMWGSWCAMVAAKIWRKPFVLRCGWEQYSTLLKKNKIKPVSFLMRSVVWTSSWLGYRAAKQVILAHNEGKKVTHNTFGINRDKVTVIPNYIDIDRFRPDDKNRDNDRLLFVGRLSHEKNLETLINACRQVGIGLDIIGDGPLREKIESKFEKHADVLHLLGIFPNDELPKLYNNYAFFVLPSIYENSPKALMEAMACGCIVLGTAVPGIREIINHGENGFLCETDTGAIVSAIAELRKLSQVERTNISNAARKTIVSTCSLKKTMDTERKIYEQIVPEVISP
jgi:glycosyltransferase involved in cell wall biosynthesis